MCRARGDGASTLGCPNPTNKLDEEEVTTQMGPTDTLLEAAPAHRLSPDAAVIKPTNRAPDWLNGLTSAVLFEPCPYHPNAHKNEGNIFCFCCTPSTGRALCRHCVPGHACGPTASSFQIRRYMYQSVVHQEDLNAFYDLHGVQTYCINSRRAVLVQPKTAPATAASAPAFHHECRGCGVPLRPDCDFCSLKCKMDSDFGVEPATPGPAGPRGLPKKKSAFHSVSSSGQAATAALRVHTVDGSEGRWRMRSSEAGTSVNVPTVSKRRKLDHPRRSPVF